MSDGIDHLEQLQFMFAIEPVCVVCVIKLHLCFRIDKDSSATYSHRPGQTYLRNTKKRVVTVDSSKIKNSEGPFTL